MKEYIVSTDTAYEFEMRRFEELQELIRCKDCKYWGADGYRNGCKYATCIMMENDYCSMAERKEE